MTFPGGMYTGANWGVFALYLSASLAAAAGLFTARHRLERTGRILALAGFAIHTLAIAWWWREVGHGPYVAPHEVLGSDAWVVMASYLFFSRLYPRVKGAALFAYPAAFALQALAMTYDPGARTLPATFRSVWLAVHVGFYKVALGTLLVGLALAVFVLVKEGKENRLPALPGAEALDVLNHRFAGFAFAFWTCGMLSGSVWAYQSWGRFWGWDPTETWSLITCLMFGGYLHARRFYRLKGRRAAWLYLFCFAVSLVSLFGMLTLKGSIHAEYFR